jgi:hypothetical protein
VRGRRLLIPLLAVLMSVACAPARETGPIVIGALYNLTGSQAELGVPSSHGAMQAVDEANRDGGVLGGKVGLVVEDGESDPAVIARRTADILRSIRAPARSSGSPTSTWRWPRRVWRPSATGCS